LRILLVSNIFPPEFVGGYELLALELATMLSAQGHEVTVATSPLVNSAADPADRPFVMRRILSLNAPWLTLDPSGGHDAFRQHYLDMRNIMAMRLLLDDVMPDRVVLFNIEGLGTLGLIAFLHACGHRPVHYMADNVFGFLLRPDTAAPYRDFSRLFRLRPALDALSVLAMSRTVYDEASQSLGQPPGQVTFVPGTVPDSLPPLPPRDGPSAPLRLVFSSRIAAHKGTGVMLDAMKLLLSRGDDGFKVDVFGGGGVPEVLQRAHAHGLGTHLHYGGLVERDEMILRFARYDALLFPTWQREPFGLVAIEAAAQGCVPIVTAQTGVAEWLMTGDAIKIDRSPEGLAGGIQRLLYMPGTEREARRQALSVSARRFFAAARWYGRIGQAVRDAGGPVPIAACHDIENAFFAIIRMWRGG
jgi:glycogen(starch) synthase